MMLRTAVDGLRNVAAAAAAAAADDDEALEHVLDVLLLNDAIGAFDVFDCCLKVDSGLLHQSVSSEQVHWMQQRMMRVAAM